MEKAAITLIIAFIVIAVGVAIIQEIGDTVYNTNSTIALDSWIGLTGGIHQLSPFAPNSVIGSNVVSVKNRTWLDWKLNNTALVTIPDNFDYSPANFGNQTTVSFWVYVNNFNFLGQSNISAYTNYLGKTTYQPTNNAEWEFRMANSSGADGTALKPCRFSFYVFNISGGLGSGAAFQDNSTSVSCSTVNNTWIHVAGRTNYTYNFIYKNGILRDLAALSIYGINLKDGNASIHLGKDIDNGQWNGSIDNLRIYNTSLTNEEIAEIYNTKINENVNQTTLYNDSWMNFNGANGQIDTLIEESTWSNYTTFTGWFYRNNNNSQHVVFGGTSGQSVLLRLDTDNDIDFWLNQTAGGSTIKANSSNLNWIHFGIAVNNTIGNITWYINGLFVKSENITSRMTGIGSFILGRKQGAGQYMNGSIDDFSIYNAVLNASDMLSIYNGGRLANSFSTSRTTYLSFNTDKFVTFYDNVSGTYIGDLNNRFITGNVIGVTHANDGVIVGTRSFAINNTNLVGHWKLNENSGVTAYDSVLGNNGTISGTTWQNDGINNSLTNGTDYTLSHDLGRVTLLNGLYRYNLISSSYDYVTGKIEESDYVLANKAAGGIATFGNWFKLIVTLIIVSVIIFIIYTINGKGQSSSYSNY